jgi:hypothetical protein
MAGKQSFVSGDRSRSGNGYRHTNDPSNDEHRSSDEIREDIGRTRCEMDTTLERLGEQLRPRRLFEAFIHALGSSGDGRQVGDYAQIAGNIGKRAVRQAERHPIPAVLFGAGLAWLVYEEFSRRRDDDEFDDRYDDWEYERRREMLYDEDWEAPPRRRASSRGITEKVGDKMSEAAESAKEAAHNVADKAKEMAGKAKEAGEKAADVVSGAMDEIGGAARSAQQTARRAGRGAVRSVRATTHGARRAARGTRRMAISAAHRAEEFGAAMGHQAERAYQRSREGFEHAVDDYPLAVGAGFAALGVLAGLAMPRTRYEDKMMGDASDRVKDMAKRTGEEVLERGKQTVETAASTLKEEARAQGLMPSSIQEKAKHVLSEAASAAKETIRHELSAEGVVDKVKQVAERVGEQVQEDARRHKDEILQEGKKELTEAAPRLESPSQGDQCSC